MKNERTLPQQVQKRFLSSVFMLLCIMLLNLSAIAQDARISEPAKENPYEMYAAKHAGSPLVKALQANPNDHQLNHAFRLAVITEYPEHFNYGAADIERFREELSQLMQSVKRTEMLVKEGHSPEDARKMTEREQARDKKMNQTKSNSSEPTLTVPNQ